MSGVGDIDLGKLDEVMEANSTSEPVIRLQEMIDYLRELRVPITPKHADNPFYHRLSVAISALQFMRTEYLLGTAGMGEPSHEQAGDECDDDAR